MPDQAMPPPVLEYDTPVQRERKPVSPFALASWIVFFANCAWFAWGLLHGVRIFYQPGSGPGASAQWRQVVMQIAAGVAAVGLLLGVIALRTSRSSRGQTYSALALNGSALAIYLVLLLS
jgi:hypothetical protein